MKIFQGLPLLFFLLKFLIGVSVSDVNINLDQEQQASIRQVFNLMVNDLIYLICT